MGEFDPATLALERLTRSGSDNISPSISLSSIYFQTDRCSGIGFEGGRTLLEKQGSATTATYTYSIGLIRKDGETPLFDGLGSERTITNSSQTVTGTVTHESFGQTVATTSSTDPDTVFGSADFRIR